MKKHVKLKILIWTKPRLQYFKHFKLDLLLNKKQEDEFKF